MKDKSVIVIIELYFTFFCTQATQSALHWTHYSFTPHSWWWKLCVQPQLPCGGPTDRNVAANLCQMAPPTATEHSLTFTRGKVGEVSCPKPQQQTRMEQNLNLTTGQQTLPSESQSPCLLASSSTGCCRWRKQLSCWVLCRCGQQHKTLSSNISFDWFKSAIWTERRKKTSAGLQLYCLISILWVRFLVSGK